MGSMEISFTFFLALLLEGQLPCSQELLQFLETGLCLHGHQALFLVQSPSWSPVRPPMAAARLPPGTASLSPQRRWQVPEACISPGPGLEPCGLALHSATSLPFLPPSSPPKSTLLAPGVCSWVSPEPDPRRFYCCKQCVWS